MSTSGDHRDRLAQLFHHRWAVPLLAELDHHGGGERMVVLRNRLGIGRESLRRTLDALIEQGLVRPNPGYGHPLRPEYLLTDRGAAVATACSLLMASLRRLGIERVALNKWSMPVIAALEQGDGRRFGQLRDDLPKVSPRALAMALKSLAAAGLVERDLIDSFPPTARYRLAAQAVTVARPLRALQAA